MQDVKVSGFGFGPWARINNLALKSNLRFGGVLNPFGTNKPGLVKKTPCFSREIWAHLRRRTPQTGLSACIFFACGKKGYRFYPLRCSKMA
ncbi:MAG: hypothetical protein LBR93_00250, partial [Treponema sp.]|nr:hypothetical protein [Treponema sp.]